MLVLILILKVLLRNKMMLNNDDGDTKKKKTVWPVFKCDQCPCFQSFQESNVSGNGHWLNSFQNFAQFPFELSDNFHSNRKSFKTCKSGHMPLTRESDLKFPFIRMTPFLSFLEWHRSWDGNNWNPQEDVRRLWETARWRWNTNTITKMHKHKYTNTITQIQVKMRTVWGLSQLDRFLALSASGIIISAIFMIVIIQSSLSSFRPNKADLEDAMMELVDIDINEDNLDFSQVIDHHHHLDNDHHHAWQPSSGLPDCRQVPGWRRWETGELFAKLLLPLNSTKGYFAQIIALRWRTSWGKPSDCTTRNSMATSVP